jgi:hypothetical protein
MTDRLPKKRLATGPTSLVRLALGRLDSAKPDMEASATTAPIVTKRRGGNAKKATTTARRRARVIPNDIEPVVFVAGPGAKLVPKRIQASPLSVAQQERRERYWLKWLVWFVQLGEQEVAAEDWGPTLDGFALFASKWATPDFEMGTAVEDPSALATALHAGFNNLIDHGKWETPAFHSLRLHVRFDAMPEVAPIGTVTDVIIFGAAQLLLKHGRRIRRCAALGCRRVFLAHKRQVHCSPTCREREKQRQFIERKGGAEGYSRYRAKKRWKRLHTWHSRTVG